MNVALLWREAQPGDIIWYDGDPVVLVGWEERRGADDENPTPFPVIRLGDGRVTTVASYDMALGARTRTETQTRRQRFSDFISEVLATVEGK